MRGLPLLSSPPSRVILSSRSAAGAVLFAGASSLNYLLVIVVGERLVPDIHASRVDSTGLEGGKERREQGIPRWAGRGKGHCLT